MFLVWHRSKVGGCRTEHRPESKESKESKATKMLHLCQMIWTLNSFDLFGACVCFVSVVRNYRISSGFIPDPSVSKCHWLGSRCIHQICHCFWDALSVSVPCQVFRSQPQTDPKQSGLPVESSWSWSPAVGLVRFGWGSILRPEPLRDLIRFDYHSCNIMEPLAHVGPQGSLRLCCEEWSWTWSAVVKLHRLDRLWIKHGYVLRKKCLPKCHSSLIFSLQDNLGVLWSHLPFSGCSLVVLW